MFRLKGHTHSRLHFARDESGSVSPPFWTFGWVVVDTHTLRQQRGSSLQRRPGPDAVRVCTHACRGRAGRTGEQLWPRFCTRVQWSVALNASTQFLEAVESLHAGRPADVIALPLDIVHFRSAALSI